MKINVSKVTTLFIFVISAFFLYNNKQVRLYFTYLMNVYPCDKVIYYKEGNIDPQFNVSNDSIVKGLNKAAQIWNSNSPKPILVYSYNAKLKVNLVYDERQRAFFNLYKSTSEFEAKKNEALGVISTYEQKSQELKSKLDDFNNQVKKWNSSKRSSEDEYKNLLNQQKQLQVEISKLNTLYSNAQGVIKNAQDLANKANANVNILNNVINLKPEEGLYTYNAQTKEQKIDIYFYEDDNQFTSIAAHEFGHAIGLDHNNNASSLMNPISNKTLTLSSDDKESFSNYCKPINKFEYLKQLFNSAKGNSIVNMIFSQSGGSRT